jgi:4-amino-4-deoxy-L-arabinose transferase-like glycosyltransferase
LQPSTLAKRVSFSLFLAIIAFYFYGLGHLPLVGPDEPRYAQVAREMFLRGDLVTPTLGGHTWFEKPALLYWIMIAAFKVFGVNEWSARLGPALCGLLTVVALWCVGHQVSRTSTGETRYIGFWSALTAATSLGLIVFARGASFDIVITMTTTWALVFFLLSDLATARRASLAFLAGFYIFVGLSLIAKGLVGVVIPFGVVGLYYLLRRQLPAKSVRRSLIWGLPLALAVAAIWYGPVISRHGWSFIEEFFVQHHFARYISNRYHHPQPIYFYLLVLIPFTLPWTVFLFDSLIQSRCWSWRNDDSLSKARVFSFAWLLLPVLFFSFSGSKLPGYILPALPATFLLLGERIARSGSGFESTKWPLRATGMICALLGATGFVFGWSVVGLSVRCSLLIALPLLIAGVVAIVLTRLRDVCLVLVACATIITLIGILNCAADRIAQRESVRDLLHLADARGYSQTPVLAQRGGDRTAEFYASGRVVYRADGEVMTIDEVTLAEARRHGQRLLVFIPVESLERFRTTPGFEVIGDNGRLALLGWKPN